MRFIIIVKLKREGDWNPIVFSEKIKSLKPEDTADVIIQIIKRLFISGYLKLDSKKNIFDTDFLKGLLKFKERNAFKTYSTLLRCLLKT